MLKKVKTKFKLYKRYKINIWGDLFVKRRFIKLIKILRGSRNKVNETKLLRKLVLRMDLRQPQKKSRKVNFRQKIFLERGLIRKLYGNYKEKEFRKLIRSYKKDKYILRNIEHRVDVIIWKAGSVPKLETAIEWIKNGYIFINGLRADIQVLKEGDILSISKSIYGEVIRNLLAKLYGKSFTSLTKFCYEVNYKTMEVSLIKNITLRKFNQRINIKGRDFRKFMF